MHHGLGRTLLLSLFTRVSASHLSGLPALDATPNNSIPNGRGPVLYYNGSGPVPSYDGTSPLPDPITPFAGDLTHYFLREIRAINNDEASVWNTSCDKCLATTQVLHLAAVSLLVDSFTHLLIAYCELVQLQISEMTCHARYSPRPQSSHTFSSDAGGLGPYYAQLYAKLNSETGDMLALCHYHYGECSEPATLQIDESHFFTPKPPSAEIAPAPAGSILEVLHISDTHFDPRYDVGSEANCTNTPCCRPYSSNDALSTTRTNASLPASRYGSLYCDTTADLLVSTFTSMDDFFSRDQLAFAIFTGDIISHDAQDQTSRDYVEYLERVTWETFRAQLPAVPIYATLGNHDSLPAAFNSPNNIAENTGHSNKHNAFSWNYDLLSSLWLAGGSLTTGEAQYASEHYGAYAHTTRHGLRIISLNSDFWYKDNIFNFINFTNPDQSGMLKFLADELVLCEHRGQRAWIIAHVLTGYEGANALPNPSNLFYSIIRRFSPATIAAVFFGHTHQDQLQIFYDFAPSSMKPGSTLRNSTDIDYSKPLQLGFVGPSVTPLTAFNAGYQVLQVDSKTFSVMGRQTYIANMSESLEWTRPVWRFEYDARSAFTGRGLDWPGNAPFNATFFDRVASHMLTNQSLLDAYNLYEAKSSVAALRCSTEQCARRKVCYIRSGSTALGRACGSSSGGP